MLLNLAGKSLFLTPQHTIASQISTILAEHHTTIDNFSFYSNGKLLESFENLPSTATILALVPLKGGKGGYGAKLKTEGGKKVRPNDNMFSRDPNGVRISVAAQEKEIIENVKRRMEEEKHVAEEREKCKVLESTLKEGQSYTRLDRAYKKDVEDTERNIGESILIGKRKIIQKMKIQGKPEIKEKKEEDQQEEKKVDEGGCKEVGQKPMPIQVQAPIEQQPLKTQIVQMKPIFASARDRFNLMFKK